MTSDVATQGQPYLRPRLRPMGVADMLDAAVNLYRRNFVKLVMITAVVIVPVSALEVIARVIVLVPLMSPERVYEGDPTPILLAGQGLSFLLALLKTVVIYGVMMPALVWVVGQRYLGRPAALRTAYGVALRRLPLMAAVMFLYLAIIVVLLIFLVLPCGVNWLGAPAVGLFISMNVLALLAPVAVLENGELMVTLKRCWLLTKSNFWRAFGLVAALYMFNLAITSGPSLLTVSAVLILADNLALGTVISTTVGTLLTVLYMPIWGIGLTMLYYDTRVRREALDLELLAGLEFQPELYVPARMKWFEKSDWKTLAILAGIVLVPFMLAAGMMLFLIALGAVLELMGG